MESLGILAGGIAHELNNILGPVVAYPDLILESLPGNSPVTEDIREIQRSAQKAAAVVQDMLTLARRGVYRMVPLCLNDIVLEYVNSRPCSDLCGRYPSVTVAMHLATDLPNIVGSAAHLSKMLMNLVTNAFEAMPEGGNVEISTNSKSVSKPLAGYEVVEPGDYVILQVSDPGTGIEPEDLGRIFEPFYSQKKLGYSGSGLGLAVVHGIVHDHNGSIDVQTKVGRGTTFIIYLPVTGEPLPEPDEIEGDLSDPESVPIIDDLPLDQDSMTTNQ
jgi:signal transduction histidine kinase